MNLNNNKALIFTVLGCNDAYVGFLAGAENGNQMYEVGIGGDTNTKTFVRRKVLGQDYGDRSIEANTNGILSCNEKREFWVDALNGLVRLGKGPTIGLDIVLEWQDPNPIMPMFAGFMSGWGSTTGCSGCKLEWILQNDCNNGGTEMIISREGKGGIRGILGYPKISGITLAI